MGIIIDASILVKIITKEPGWEKLEKLLREGETLDLALIETSIWRKSSLLGIMKHEDSIVALKAVKDILPQLLIIHKSTNFLQRAMEVSINEKIPIYDSLYIALAEDRKEKLVTADKKQYEVALKYVKAELY
ncbi:type II toxin-antitoxin system VapC family toxin [Acidianus sp. HS-5]|uniref:type II toxin-antitoxin system VapC family toxin n=1 Tax=Acidianus sp. HS-5 TaxID=2886040 RepID=UPI003211B2AB